MDIEKYKIQQIKLTALVKTLKKSMPLSELEKLDKKHKGILLVFWRHYYLTQANFCLWFDFMRAKDPNWEEYYANKFTSVAEEVVDIEEDIEEDNIDEEHELTIEEKIAAIRERHGN